MKTSVQSWAYGSKIFFWICVCVVNTQKLFCLQNLVLNVGIKASWYTKKYIKEIWSMKVLDNKWHLDFRIAFNEYLNWTSKFYKIDS